MTLGIIVAAPRGRARFQYAFTPADVVWLGRLLAVAASGPYRSRLRAILWRALARFASSERPGLSLAAFIQRLEPSLPRVPWAQLPPRARLLALAAGRGHLRRRHPNAPVQVMPRGGFAPAGYGSGAPSYGWSGESELMETAPPGDAQSPAPPAPPVVAAPAPDAPPVGDAGAPADDMSADDGGTEPPMADEPMPAPASFDTRDGNRLDLNRRWLRALMRRWRRSGQWPGVPQVGYSGQPSWRAGYPYTGYQGSPYARYPYARPAAGGWAARPGVRPPLGAASTLVGRLRRLARNARRVGTLRAVASGRRYPVFGGRIAGRNYRIVARPRGLRNEIMAVRAGELQQELAG
jgi:hypothetical protein